MGFSRFAEFLRKIEFGEFKNQKIPIRVDDPNFGYWDTLALISAILTPAKNRSDILLARFVLALKHLEYRTIENKWVKASENIRRDDVTLATFFIHGGRILLQSEITTGGLLYNRIKNTIPIDSRVFSSHDLEFTDHKWQETKIKMPSFKFWSPRKHVEKHEAIDLAIYGEENYHPLTGQKVASNGNHGHLLLLYATAILGQQDPKAISGVREGVAECFAFAVETASSMHYDAYGHFHGITAGRAPISVAGTDKGATRKQVFDKLLKDLYPITSEPINNFRISLDPSDTSRYLDFLQWDVNTLKKRAIGVLFGDPDFAGSDDKYMELKNRIAATLQKSDQYQLTLNPEQLPWFFSGQNRAKENKISMKGLVKPKLEAMLYDCRIFWEIWHNTTTDNSFIFEKNGQRQKTKFNDQNEFMVFLQNNKSILGIMQYVYQAQQAIARLYDYFPPSNNMVRILPIRKEFLTELVFCGNNSTEVYLHIKTTNISFLKERDHKTEIHEYFKLTSQGFLLLKINILDQMFVEYIRKYFSPPKEIAWGSFTRM